MVVKIFSSMSVSDLEKEIQKWLNENESLEIISVTQSEDDTWINVTIIAK